MILERSVSFEIRDDSSDGEGDGLTLSGHAAVFNQETEIDSWEGTFTESIAPGAFKKTIRERTPVLQFEHGRHPLIGSIPIGKITDLREDETGLAVSARLTDNWLIQPVRDAITDKAVNGMSFRFEVIREEWRDNTGKLIKPEELMDLLWSPGERGPIKRTLKELKVAELGPVVFPAYVGTDVSVRARQAAKSVYQDKKLVHSIRSSLALGWNAYKADKPSDLEKEVATAILFDSPISDNHQSATETGKQFLEAVREYGISSTEAAKIIAADESQPQNIKVAPIVDHSTETVSEDAPLNKEEHPSQEASKDFRSKIHYALRAMDRRLDNAMEYNKNGRL